jgi:Tfp pilus assembly protein PilZ
MSRGVDNRRGYKRVKAPILCRPARLSLKVAPVDVGLGGLRVYTDEAFKVGERLEIELFLPDESTLVCVAKVAWVKELEATAAAKFDLGLQFLEVPDDARARLAAVLDGKE